MKAKLDIRRANPIDPTVGALLEEHATRARKEASCAYALDPDELESNGVVLFGAWRRNELISVGGIRPFERVYGELKAFFTIESGRGTGAGAAVLGAIEEYAHQRAIEALFLETGSWPYFAAARAFYRKHGFIHCGPFADYPDDTDSVFMRKNLVC